LIVQLSIPLVSFKKDIAAAAGIGAVKTLADEVGFRGMDQVAAFLKSEVYRHACGSSGGIL